MRETPYSDDPIHLSKSEYLSLAGKMTGAYQRLDEALAHTLEMTSEMVRTASKNGLEVETGQLLFSDMAVCLDSIVQTRKHLVKAHRRAHVIRMRSTQRMEGCPPPHIDDGQTVVALSAAA